MNSASKPFLGVLMAIVTMAVVSSPALGAIEVKTEPNPGNHCGAVVVEAHIATGGCGLHAVGQEDFDIINHNHLTGAESILTVCTSEFEARIGETGEGYIYNPHLQGVSCFVDICREDDDGMPGNDHGPVELWPLRIEDVGTTEVLEVRFCITQKGSETEALFCTLHIPIAKITHTYIFNAEPNQGCEELGDEREVEGRWTIESAGEAAHNRIEIVNT